MKKEKIVVIGGGDTAQDVLRWVARYFNDSKLPSSQLEVLVRGSQYKKCGRCWHHTADVGSNTEHADLCARCISNVFGDGDHRLFA